MKLRKVEDKGSLSVKELFDTVVGSLKKYILMDSSELNSVLEDWEYPAVIIAASSKDNINWTDVSSKKPVTLAGGASIYLKLKRYIVDVDFTKQGRLANDCSKYNDLPSFFTITIGGRGRASMSFWRGVYFLPTFSTDSTYMNQL